MFFSFRARQLAALIFFYSLSNAVAFSFQSHADQQTTDSQIVGEEQKKDSETTKSSQQTPPAETSEEADEPATPVPAKAKTDSNAALSLAWQMLTSAVSSPKAQLRIDGLNAISSLPNSSKTRALINKGMEDPDRDVRIAAVVATGNMQDRTFIPQLRQLLDDRAPEVGFASAVALWKMHDVSGENILESVLTGEQKASSGFLSSGLHQANKDLHNPSTLALIGAEQGAYAMLGPFGIGLDAYRLLHKGNTANSARVLAANLLSSSSNKQVQQEFITALQDKNYFVRAASARALGNFRGEDIRSALLEAFGDQKPAVRFFAAASYIRTTTVTPERRHRHSPSKARRPSTTHP